MKAAWRKMTNDQQKPYITLNKRALLEYRRKQRLFKKTQEKHFPLMKAMNEGKVQRGRPRKEVIFPSPVHSSDSEDAAEEMKQEDPAPVVPLAEKAVAD